MEQRAETKKPGDAWLQPGPLATLWGCRRTRPLEVDPDSGGEGPERFTGEDEYPAARLPLVTGLVHTKGEKLEVCLMRRKMQEAEVEVPPVEVRIEQTDKWNATKKQMVESMDTEKTTKHKPRRLLRSAPGDAIRAQMGWKKPDVE